MECMFQCVQNSGKTNRRTYASPAKVDIGSFVAPDRDLSSIRDLSPRSGRREPVDLYKHIYCKILCSACYSRNGALDIFDCEVCVPADSSGSETRFTFVLHLQ